MKKKLYVTFVMGLIASCLLVLLSVTAGFPFFSGLPKTNVVSAEAVETVDAADAVYTFSATTPASSSPVVIGPNRQVDLQDGESVVMQFTIVSCTFSYHTDGILVSKRNGVPTSNPMSSTGAIGWIHNGGAADFSGKVGEGEAAFTNDTVGNGATIFAAGNTVRATFTPMQSQTELGVFTIEYKTAGSDDWVLGAKASGLGESFGRNAQIWLFFSVNAAGSASITLTDYTITTTYGANLLDSEDGRKAENANNNGQWVYDTIGLAYVHSGSTYTAKAAAEDRVSNDFTITTTTASGGNTENLMIYPSQSLSLNDEEIAVLEFDVLNSELSGKGFRYTVSSKLGGIDSFSNGIAMGSASGHGAVYGAQAGFSGTMTDKDADGNYYVYTNGVSNVRSTMASGNSVKVVYKPYTSDESKGYLAIYTKTVGSEYELKCALYNIHEKTQTSDLRGIVKDNVYIGLAVLGSNNVLSLGNLRYYKQSASSSESKTGGELYGKESIYVHLQNSGTYTISHPNITVSVKENTMSFTGAGKDYTVYVKENGSYKLPKPTVEGATFIGWKDGEKLYKAGTDVSISENKVYSAVILRDWETVGAAVSVNEFMGLRFESTFNTEDYANASGFISEYGTLIARVGDIGTANDLTVSTNAAVKKITSTVTYSEKDGKTTYAGGISRLRVHNYDVEIVGCGYMVVNYESGAETVYTSVIVRTAKGIAEQCLSDNVYSEDDFEYKVLQAYIDGEEFPVEE